MKLDFFAHASNTREMQAVFRSLYEYAVANLKDFDKNYSLEFKEQRTKTRYKYYWGHIIQVIFNSGVFQALDDEYVTTVEDVHELLKWQKASKEVAFRTPGGKIYVIPRSTKELTDGEFIGQYEEAIVAEYTERGLTFLTREEYADQQKIKHHRYKL